MGAVAVAATVAIVGVGLALEDDEASVSQTDYQAAVVNARNRVDFALGRLSKAQSPEELLGRMDEAADAIGDTAGDLDDMDAPDPYADAHGRLVEQLEQLAADVQGIADQARTPGFEDTLTGARGFDFESWDAINSILAELRGRGIDVEPLARQTTA